MVSERKTISRRDLLQTGCGLLTAVLCAPLKAHAYEQIQVKNPAKISGSVRLQGPRPGRPARVKLSGDCAFCRRFDIRKEDLLVSGTGGLRNVAVFLEGIRRGKPIPTGVPKMAENRCTFVPHLLTVTAGSKLLLHNQDPVLNTFHAVELSSGRTLFNIGMPNRDQRVHRRIRPSGVIQMRCDVHPWEVAHIVSVDHPYHTVTNSDGRFVLDHIPPGSYTLVLWHETLGAQRKHVKLEPGKSLQLKLSYSAQSVR